MEVHIPDILLFKKQVLRWANQFDICAIYDTHRYEDRYTEFDLLIAADFTHKLQANFGNAFEKLKAFRQENKAWLFGGLGYDLKNETENLSSSNPDYVQFPDLFFFAPKHLLLLKNHTLKIYSPIADSILTAINDTAIAPEKISPKIPVQCRFSKEDYIQTVKKLQNEISQGNIYEANFCVEFFSESIINPAVVYENLGLASPAPFSNYFKWFAQYSIGASPERFLAKRGKKLISQPIKGTAKRSNNIEIDKLAKEELLHNPKERQENVMIVDLVRNDLTRSASPGSVKVEELFGIYSFAQVHQMISTVVCEAQPDKDIIDIVKNTFPMGSMTGAPKIKAMQLIEQLEKSKRGIYSGAIGYITPDDDFDFNVVIRSILYNSSTNYLSFHAGSAITYFADAEKEYQECLVKISALLKVLNGEIGE